MPAKAPAAVITGATGGIGAALVAAFTGAGYRVVATDLPGHTVATPGVAFVPLDLARLVTDETYAAASVGCLLAELGDEGLDVLINNAAVQVLGGVDSLARDGWQRSLDINITAPFLLVQALLSSLEKAAGCVINISSIHARLTKKDFVAYATSKAALSGLTRAMAVDLEGRVRVNAIEPAAIETPMLRAGFAAQPEKYRELERAHPVRRIGRSEEVAALALAVAGQRGGFMHGACIALDGGISNRLHDPA